jgi:hypothetical protein
MKRIIGSVEPLMISCKSICVNKNFGGFRLLGAQAHADKKPKFLMASLMKVSHDQCAQPKSMCH